MAEITRRQLVSAGAAAFLSLTWSATAPAADDGAAVEEWMTTWMSSTKLPIGALHVGRFVEPIYYLTKPIRWKPNPGQEDQYQAVDVPVGFVTDFASIPRVFWSLLRPDGMYTYPAILHDFLYWTQERPRDVADQIFRIGMEDFSINRAVIDTIYSAVRLGGGSAWENNAKAKANGEKRILKEFPDDPRTRWKEWKRRLDVFL